MINFVYTQLNVKAVLFQTIQFIINTQVSFFTHKWDSIRCYHSGPELTCEQCQWRVLRFPESSSITEASSSFSVISGTLVGDGVLFLWRDTAVYSEPPADWATRWRSLTSLQRSSQCTLKPQPTGPQNRETDNPLLPPCSRDNI